MRLPFTETAFLDVFGDYNATLWPALVALWIATAAAAVQFWRRRLGSRALTLLLAFHWGWSAIAYHAVFFSRINPAAWVFAALFALEAGLVLWYGLGPPRLVFDRGVTPRHYLAAALVAYSLAYPALVIVTGHTWPRAPTFGVPCPTTLFTAGALLATPAPPPRGLFVVPVLWAGIGGSAALLLSVRPDLMLAPAGAALLVYALAPGLLGRKRAA